MFKSNKELNVKLLSAIVKLSILLLTSSVQSAVKKTVSQLATYKLVISKLPNAESAKNIALPVVLVTLIGTELKFNSKSLSSTYPAAQTTFAPSPVISAPSCQVISKEFKSLGFVPLPLKLITP